MLKEKDGDITYLIDRSIQLTSEVQIFLRIKALLQTLVWGLVESFTFHFLLFLLFSSKHGRQISTHDTVAAFGLSFYNIIVVTASAGTGFNHMREIEIVHSSAGKITFSNGQQKNSRVRGDHTYN